MSQLFKSIGMVIGIIFALTACQNKTVKTDAIDTQFWQLNTQMSGLSFVSTKNKTFTEQHSLKFNQGMIGRNQLFTASIDLNTIDTLIPIRDQRLRDILFETETHPNAKISTELLLDLELDMTQNVSIPFTLDLHGIQKSFNAEVVIQRVKNQLVVVNYEPILVNAKDFAMDDAVNQLTQIAGLQSIDYSVLVDFKLTFEKR